MAIFSGLLFLTLPTGGVGGSFIAFYGVFLGAVPDGWVGEWFYLPDDLRYLP
ncbi:major facilitator superfamily nitrite extrusion protein [Salmonella enterica subsp. enterica]|uniref:Major facilitator superfamily nitrite extrusion protein n=1 Tax=Salmonella enterica I TaxID=59201 RepID=A0A379UT74_SALET|nr:major facilitator superfamily nitrite extrusion protein [Salmonella enterica subsp. enterica]